MKRKWIVSLSLLAALSLVGCGSTSEEGTTPGVLDDGDLQFDDSGNIVYENVELKMWSVTTGVDANVQDSIIAQFNDLYDGMIHVTTTHTSRYDLESAITTTMEFDRANAPDIFFSHGSRANEYQVKNWLLPIEPHMEKAGLIIDREDFVPTLLNSTEVDGQIYGLPQDVHSAMVVVRKDILERNDLAMPTNYEELVEVCDQAVELASSGQLYIRGTNSDGIATDSWRLAKRTEPYYPFPIAYGDMWVHEFLGYTAAAQNGATFVGEDGYPGWNSEATVEGLQLLRDWIFPSASSLNEHPFSLAYGSDYDVGNTPFRGGNAIFKLLGPWEYGNDLTNFGNDLRNDGGSDNITTVSLSNLFASDDTQDYAKNIKGEGHAFMLMSTVQSMTKRCAAMVFADWMVNNAGITWAKQGHLPSLRSVELSRDYLEDPAYESYIKNWGSCDDYVVISPTPYYGYVDSYFKNVVQKAMASSYQSTSIASILQEEYEDCVDYIDLYA